MILLSLSAGACNTNIQQTTGTESSTTTNQSILTVSGSVAGYYANMEELSGAADLIAYGEIDGVIEVQEYIMAQTDREDILYYTTDFNFSISQVLKGDEKEEAIIHQLGAAGKMVVTEDPLFEQGEKYVLFLHKTESGVYYVLGAYQGRFKVVDGKVFSMDNVIDDKIFISPELSYNGIELEDFIGDIYKALK
jgi:hypothetical protein